MSCRKVYSEEVLHFTETLIYNMIYVCIARKFVSLAAKRSLYEYEQSDQSKRIGGVLKKVTPHFTPSLTSHEEI